MKYINLKILLPILILATSLLVFFALLKSKPSAQPAPVKERVWQVKTQAAQHQTLSPTLTLYGQIETPALVKAVAPNKSRVIMVAVREGDRISKGQPLLHLDPRDFEPLVLQAKAKVSELEAIIQSEQLHHKSNKLALKHELALLELNKSSVDRAEMLKNKKLGSVAALEEMQQSWRRQKLATTERNLLLQDHSATHQQLLARLQYAQAELELAELSFERSQIIAPFDGYIENLQVASGDQVKENQQLISFYPLNELEVRAKIPTSFQHELQQTLQEGAALFATAYLSGIKLKLQFDRVAGLADARGIDGLFKITQGNDLVRLGSTLSLKLQRSALHDVIAIPFSALYDNDRIYKLVNGQLAGVKVKRLGEYTQQDGVTVLLISGSEIRDKELIVTTHLPNAINGLRAVSTDS